MSNDRDSRTTPEFAELLGVDVRYIQKLGVEVFPQAKMKRGLWNIAVALPLWREWYASGGYIKKPPRSSTEFSEDEDDGLDTNEQRALLYAAQREKLELANALTRGEHLLASEVELTLQEIQSIYNNNIDALEGRLTGNLISATKAPNETIINVIRPEINAVRSDTANALQSLANRLATCGNS